SFHEHLVKARELFQQKRIFETVDELRKAEEIFSESPDIFTLLGACQVEFRAFDKAMGFFEEANKLAPNNPNVLFNIGEVYFVQKDWEKSKETFEEVMALVEKGNQQFLMSRLVEFKLLLCHIKMDEIENAKELAAKYDFLDDSPFPYYADAALAFHEGRDIDAEIALARAGRIFKNPAMIAPWKDTLMEFGYIKSFY
ncbi:MAG: hypothetical protein ACQKBU_11680, partial [Verrucomicrobiales bacterium]